MKLLPFLLAVCLVFPARAQITENPFVRPADQKSLNEDALAFLDAATPLVEDASNSTVGIYVGNHRLAYGVAVSDELIISKWSELASAPGPLRGLGRDGKVRALQAVSGSQEHDLVFLSYTGEALPAIDLGDGTDAEAGDFLFVPRSDGKVAGAGVVSVAARSLRIEDRGYLGVAMSRRPGADPVRISEIVKGSAADAAGLQVGDRVLKIDEETIESFDELSNVLKRSGAGEDVVLQIEREGRVTKVVATLKGTDNPYIHRQRPLDGRSRRMQRMGVGALSRGPSSFPNVIQTDLDVEARDAGAPVVNLEGQVVGVVISRASRIKTYVLPASVIQELMDALPGNR